MHRGRSQSSPHLLTEGGRSSDCRSSRDSKTRSRSSERTKNHERRGKCMLISKICS